MAIILVFWYINLNFVKRHYLTKVTFYESEVCMKNNPIQLQIPELKASLSHHVAVPKTELRHFYRTRAPNFTEQFFRRVLYTLEKERVLIPLGSGMYALKEQENRRNIFSYSPSKKLSSVYQLLQKAFPYLDYLCWETGLLHEFMTHQPGQSVLVVEAEKDACESVFNNLREKYGNRVFLDPTRSLMETYVLPQTDPIIVLPLISQSPRTIYSGIPFPKLEKILVDIFVDEKIFFVFQGEELSNIYTSAFTKYWVNERTMFRYAGRRKAGKRLTEFIQEKTKIQLALQEKNKR
jgi:hypothetical protein